MGHSLTLYEDHAQMKTLSNRVKDLSKEMTTMSHLLGSGMISDREFEMMRVN